jgi:hypothetical protein
MPPPSRDEDLRKNATIYAEFPAASSPTVIKPTPSNPSPAYPAQEAPHSRPAPQPSASHPLAAQPAPQAQAAMAPSRPHSLARLRCKPEVLAPVGGWPQLRAAVENGADAVYFGLSDLNARARASNFAPEELPEVMAYLHDRGAKGYVVLNVLVFDEELPLVARRAAQMAAAGVDAVIVQVRAFSPRRSFAGKQALRAVGD